MLHIQISSTLPVSGAPNFALERFCVVSNLFTASTTTTPGHSVRLDSSPSKNHRFWEGFLSAPRLAEVDKVALGCCVVQLAAPRFAESIADQLAIGQLAALYARHMSLKQRPPVGI